MLQLENVRRNLREMISFQSIEIVLSNLFVLSNPLRVTSFAHGSVAEIRIIACNCLIDQPTTIDSYYSTQSHFYQIFHSCVKR